MISTLGLITLLLRLSLAIQGQIGMIEDLVHQNELFSCTNERPDKEYLSNDADGFYGNISLIRKLEKEERVEVEGEGFPNFSTEISFDYHVKSLLISSGAGFCTKPIRGSLLPLYDIFHSWKIHLS
jgi:hypothetical protein